MCTTFVFFSNTSFSQLLQDLSLFGIVLLPDTRFSQFFEGPSFSSIVRTGQVNKTAETAKFRKDFNYDIVMQRALGNSTALYMR